MVHHSIDLDLASALAPPRRCPACDSQDLLPVSDEQGVVFLCDSCSRTWVSELGTLAAADTVRPAPPAAATAQVSDVPEVPVPRAGRAR